MNAKMWDEIMEQPAALGGCLECNASVLQQVVARLKAQRIDRVVIAARGTSDHAGVYGKYALEMLVGTPVALAASSIYTIYNRTLKLDNALVIGISQSGRAEDVLEVLHGANESGALTVAITNYPDSPVAREARFHLCCEAGVERSVAATKTFITQIFLLALLSAEWAGDEALLKDLRAIPLRMAQTFDIAGEIGEKVERYRFMQECFVLARGVNYAVALEAALKIQETTFVRAKAFASSDFQHGPIAMIDSDIPVIVYAPDGPSLPNMSAMADRLASSGIELVVISNNRDLLSKGACAFAIPPESNDILSPFFNAAVAQMFACKLAVVKGMDPDNPKGLTKVTITR
jgi:glucosamine--fructose-6-phosphate aminotransferase (isomerizing)